MTSRNLVIDNLYSSGYLYNEIDYFYERLYATTFASRKQVNIDEAVKLAMELPVGAFVAGNFVQRAAIGETINFFDVFFDGSETLKSLVRRIQHAREGSYLHGYVSTKSLRSFADDQFSRDPFIVFTHPTKPKLRLVRIRWYSRPEEAIDKFDCTIDQFAIDHELNVVFRNSSLNDIRSRTFRLLTSPFRTAAGYRLDRMVSSGWTFHGEDSEHEQLLRRVQIHTRELTRNGTPIPDNIDGYMAYEL